MTPFRTCVTTMPSNEEDFEALIEEIEHNENPSDEAFEAAASSMAFVKSFHDFMKDWRMVTTNNVDVDVLEKAFDALVAEHQAACIFLASFKGVEDKLMATHQGLMERKEDAVPALVVNGYKKLAERVARTRASFSEE